ncbi:MAG: QueT transporter family protein [Erysipelotrichaceae bacterium]|nr:QueT transporter family protein [Erysipelotrichaceae bacterium]
MKKDKIMWMARIAIVAALYVVLTLISYPFSYGMIQFRISEALMLLCCYDKRYTWSMVVGCIVSNLFSFDLIDCIFGTLATLLACIAMVLIKKKIISSFAPAISNGIIIGLELYFVIDAPLLLSMIGVAVGELVVVVLLGNIIFYYIEKDKKLMEVIGIKKLLK